MDDGSINIMVDLDDTEAEKRLVSLRKKILDLQTQLTQQTDVRSQLAEEFDRAAAAADAAKQKLAELQAEKARLEAIAPGENGYGMAQQQLVQINQQIKEQEALVKQLDQEYNRAGDAVDKQDQKIRQTTSSIEALKQEYAEVQRMVSQTGDRAEEAGGRAERGAREAGRAAVQGASEAGGAADGLALKLEKLFTRIVKLAKRVFFFSVITKALRGLKSYLSSAMQTSDEFQQAMARMKGALMTAFQPIFSAALPAITALINIVTRAMQVIGSFISMLFGTTYSASAAAAESLNDEAKAISGVGGAAGKASKKLLAFDEINQMTKDGGGGGSSAAETKPIFGDLPDKIAGLFDDIDFSGVEESFARLKESVSGFVDTIREGLSWAWENVLQPLTKWTIEEVVPRVLEALAAAFDLLNSVFQELAPLLEPFWENTLKPLFEAVGKIVTTGLDKLIELLKDLKDVVEGKKSWQEFIGDMDGLKTVLLALGGVAVITSLTRLAKGLAVAAGKLGLWALAVTDALAVAYDVQALKEAADAYDAAQEAHTHETEVALNSYKKLYEENGKEVADEWAKMVYNIDTSGMELDEAMKAIAGEVEKNWDGIPQNMWDGFKAGWEDYFGENGKGLLQLLKDAWNGAITGIKEMLGIHSPSTVFYAIGDDVAQGIWDGFKDVWTQFTTWISSAWNGLKTWWSGLRLKSPEISDSGGGSEGSVPVPHLARGAVIPPNREFLAVLGDQTHGTNIEAPLDTIVAAFRQAMGEGGNRTIVLQVDKQELGRIVFDTYNAESGRVGMRLGGAP